MTTLELQDTRSEIIPKNTKVLCVCDHGRSRSKYVARALYDLGYVHARVLGIRDHFSTRQEKLAEIKAHDLILCSSGTTLSDLQRLFSQSTEQLPTKILNLELSESLHSKLYARLKGINGHPDETDKEITEKLKKLGFA